jgi:hypothetical protein
MTTEAIQPTAGSKTRRTRILLAWDVALLVALLVILVVGF